MLLLYKKNPHLLQCNSLIYHEMHTHVTSEIPTTSIMKLSFPLSTTKRKNHLLNKYLTLIQYQPSFPHDDFLKMSDKNITFKEDIEATFKKEVIKQL